MFQIVWGLCNIAVFFLFVIFIIRITKRIKSKFGVLISFLFVLISLSLVNHLVSRKDAGLNQGKTKTWAFDADKSIDKSRTYNAIIEMDKTLVSNYRLYLMYGKDTQQETSIPISSTSTMSGFVSGRKWIPTEIKISPAECNSFDYQVCGMVKWNLLGVEFFTETKEYKGTILLN